MMEERPHKIQRFDFSISKAGIITKKDTPEAVQYGLKLRSWLKNKHIAAVLDQINADLDILIILGGDGTLLHVAEAAARHSIPVIGINLGNLGFLTELIEDETESALQEILRGTVTIENRLMLKACLHSQGHKTSYRYALNDVVINKNTLDRLLRLSTSADDDHITTYKADGLIFSTPTGSTAYSLSAGGPLVHPGLATILVTPICPFMLSSRPIILPPSKVISSKFLGDETDSNAKVIVDGQDAWEMKSGDILEVQTAEQPLQLISSTQRDYFTILRNKLNWGSNDQDT